MRHCFFFLLLLSPALLPAQRTFRAGLTAGLNGSQVHGDNASGFDKAGFVGGGFVCTDPSQRFYGQMELQYSMKGSRKQANPNAGDYVSFGIDLDYVEVPFLLRWNYSGKVKTRFMLELGLTLGALVRAKEYDSFGAIAPKPYSRAEIALATGIGIPFGKDQQWVCNLRYTNSIIPVYKFPGGPIFDPRPFFRYFNRGFYNNVLGLTLQYRFPQKSES